MQIEKLSIDQAVLDPSTKDRLCVSIDGIEARDFLACCDNELLCAIIAEAGAELCAEIHADLEFTP